MFKLIINPITQDKLITNTTTQDNLLTIPVNEICIRVMDIVPNQKIDFLVDYRSNMLGTLYQKQITIDGEDYSNWGDDDNYIVSLIAQKLGIENYIYATENEI